MSTTTHTSAIRSGLMGGYIRAMDRLSRFSAYIACVMFIAGVLVICQMVFTRYVLGWSTSWQTEFTVFSVTGAMLMGSPYVLMTGGHVAITILPDAIGGLGRKVMLTIASLFGFAFCAALAYAAGSMCLKPFMVSGQPAQSGTRRFGPRCCPWQSARPCWLSSTSPTCCAGRADHGSDYTGHYRRCWPGRHDGHRHAYCVRARRCLTARATVRPWVNGADLLW
ncbi:TRAP transporter small permease [Halovibrio variabilis]|uniref:TRAP transporter small permease n=1 Tax=Halovibrio variabilis TaxID=31910 RepID=UPI0027D996DF|nr:TRAP transporter small permease subunit [Halovibrio variabilis]